MTKTYGPTELPPFRDRPKKRSRSGARQGGLATKRMLDKVESGSRRTPIALIREQAAETKRWRIAVNPDLGIIDGLRGLVEGTRKHYLAKIAQLDSTIEERIKAWDLHSEALAWLAANTPPPSGFNIQGSRSSLKFS